mgnify:CR=1 FL=1
MPSRQDAPARPQQLRENDHETQVYDDLDG